MSRKCFQRETAGQNKLKYIVWEIVLRTRIDIFLYILSRIQELSITNVLFGQFFTASYNCFIDSACRIFYTNI